MKRQLIASLTLGLMWSVLSIVVGSPAVLADNDNLTLQQVTDNVYGIVGPLHDRLNRSQVG